MLITGWKSIASHLGAGVRTVQRWEASGLPIKRPSGALRGPVMAYTEDLDGWVRHRIAGSADDAIARALRLYHQSTELRGKSKVIRGELLHNRKALRQLVSDMRMKVNHRNGEKSPPGTPTDSSGK